MLYIFQCLLWYLMQLNLCFQLVGYLWWCMVLRMGVSLLLLIFGSVGWVQICMRLVVSVMVCCVMVVVFQDFVFVSFVVVVMVLWVQVLLCLIGNEVLNICLVSFCLSRVRFLRVGVSVWWLFCLFLEYLFYGWMLFFDQVLFGMVGMMCLMLQLLVLVIFLRCLSIYVGQGSLLYLSMVLICLLEGVMCVNVWVRDFLFFLWVWYRWVMSCLVGRFIRVWCRYSVWSYLRVWISLVWLMMLWVWLLQVFIMSGVDECLNVLMYCRWWVIFLFGLSEGFRRMLQILVKCCQVFVLDCRWVMLMCGNDCWNVLYMLCLLFVVSFCLVIMMRQWCQNVLIVLLVWCLIGSQKCFLMLCCLV